MPTVKIITVKKPGVQSLGYTDSGTFYTNVPVGTKAVFVRLTPLNPDADVEVVTSQVGDFQGIEFWKFPTEFIDFFIDTVDVEQNPDGTFPQSEKAKLPDWLYTNGLINKVGFGLIKMKHLPWIIAAVLGYLILTDEKK
jgi:hypothetical protein